MRRLIPALIAALALSFAALAAADVLVYKSNFTKRADIKRIKKFQGGKACKKAWKGKRALGVSAQGRRACRLRTPVEGDAARPDHAIQVVGKVLKKGTDRRIRRSVYVGAALRVGKGSHYEIRVFPKPRTWELVRNGRKVAGARESAIGALGKPNKIRLTASGRSVVARVNGTNLTQFRDDSPDQVGGRRVALSFGSTARRENPVGRGAFGKVRVLVPDPTG